MKAEHAQFAGSVPQNYDQYLGPLFFEPYAVDITQRADAAAAKKVLEIACGTGRVTRHLVQHLSPDATLTATDLNAGMTSIAKQQMQYPNLQFAEADAQQLPFEDNSFDLVVCQFGFMFVPDKQRAFNEAFRVLKSGGKLLFNVWDKLENNQLTIVIKSVVSKYLDEGAAGFYNVPFSFYDQSTITLLLKNAGFKNVLIETVCKEGTNVSALEAAKGLILGTPAFNIISEKAPDALTHLIESAAKEIAALFGNEVVKTTLNALVCEAIKY